MRVDLKLSELKDHQLSNWWFLGPWEEVLLHNLANIIKEVEIRYIESPLVDVGVIEIKKCFESVLSGFQDPKM